MSNASGRPKGGYKNKEGKRVPGVTTILGRWKESGGLIQWAYQCGRDGIDINEARDRAADAGTCAHEMIQCDVHGIKFDPKKWDEGILAKAWHCFEAYVQWKGQTKLMMACSEKPMVSEKHQFGGTLDAAFVSDRLALADWKTSSGIYVDHLIQVAGGYSLLWEENREEKITGVHILRVSKPTPVDEDNQDSLDAPISFHHHYWGPEIIPLAQKQFLLLREAYELDKILKGQV